MTTHEKALLTQVAGAVPTDIGTPKFGNFLAQQHKNAAEADVIKWFKECKTKFVDDLCP